MDIIQVRHRIKGWFGWIFPADAVTIRDSQGGMVVVYHDRGAREKRGLVPASNLVICGTHNAEVSR